MKNHSRSDNILGKQFNSIFKEISKYSCHLIQESINAQKKIILTIRKMFLKYFMKFKLNMS